MYHVPGYTGPSEGSCAGASPFGWQRLPPFIVELLAHSASNSRRVDLFRSQRWIADPRGREACSLPGGPGWPGGTDPPLSGGPGQIIRCWSDLLADVKLAADAEAVTSRIPIIPPRAWTVPREAAPVARQPNPFKWATAATAFNSRGVDLLLLLMLVAAPRS